MNIQEQVDLYPYNTFKIHAKAQYYTAIHTVEEFQTLVKNQVYKQGKNLILGGGSNMLLKSNYQGLVIKVDIKGIEVISQDESTVTIKAGAGEVWHALVLHCVANDWGGIENLSLIPGTVGAAPIQNIGAYGVEIKEVIKNVEAIDLVTGEVKVFSNSECEFGYRESVFKQKLKGKYFISSVTLTFTKKNHRFNTTYGAIETTLKEHQVNQLSVRAISNAVISIRQQKLPDPNKIGNAGSFFKNPTIALQQYDKLKNTYPDIPGYSSENQHIKVPAAWLIEQCGWKGKTFENIGVHPHQALVLVNYGDGTGEKIWDLALKILASVKEKFDIQLQPEVNVV
jgi:UDP-N-acetylmuramate dehydrogenase